jgi:outer membrane biogenesis lipoprotein LolB
MNAGGPFGVQSNSMKRAFLLLLCASVLATGCAIEIGNRPAEKDTLGQQLVDLKKAKDSGAISDSEYEAQKAKLLGSK